MALGMFLNGLRGEIRVRIRSKDSEDILSTMHLAREIERELNPSRWSTRNSLMGNKFTPPRNESQQRGARSTWTTGPSRLSRGNIQNRTGQHTRETGQKSQPESKGSYAPPRTRGTSNMTHSEYGDLRARGLCFKCREPYSPTHVCANRSVRIMLIDEDEGETTDYGVSLQRTVGDEPQSEEPRFQSLELSAVFAFGFDGPRIMKLIGVMCQQPVVVMIDSGATHCFISKEMVEKLKIPIDKESILPVRLGDGQNTQTAGFCPSIVITLGDNEFEISAYAFPVSGVDVILGITWLATLGDVCANWANKMMTFKICIKWGS